MLKIFHNKIEKSSFCANKIGTKSQNDQPTPAFSMIAVME